MLKFNINDMSQTFATIALRAQQKEWLNNSDMNFSKFVRRMLDEEIAKAESDKE